MPRIDFDFVGERQKLGVQGVMENTRHLLLLSSQVRPTDCANEQGVAGHDEPGSLTAPLVGDQQTQAVRRMPWRMQNLDFDIADIEQLSVLQRQEVVVHLTVIGFVQAIGGLNLLGQRTTTRVMVGVDMGVDDVGDFDIGLTGRLHEPILVASHHIDRDGFAQSSAAEKVRQGGLLGRQLLEEHGCLLRKRELCRPPPSRRPARSECCGGCLR